MKKLLLMFLIFCSSSTMAFVEMSEGGVVSQGFFGETSIVINGQRVMVSPDLIIRDTNGTQVNLIPANTTIQYERVDSGEPNAPISQIWIVE